MALWKPCLLWIQINCVPCHPTLNQHWFFLPSGLKCDKLVKFGATYVFSCSLVALLYSLLYFPLTLKVNSHFRFPVTFCVIIYWWVKFSSYYVLINQELESIRSIIETWCLLWTFNYWICMNIYFSLNKPLFFTCLCNYLCVLNLC